MADGSGLASLIPPLTDAQYLKDNRSKLPCIIKYGIEGPIEINGKSYNEKMEGFIHLTDAEISNIANYVLHKWSAQEAPMLPEDVSTSLSNCVESSK
jgi:mono/diheme cytochrome c family protein